MFLVEVYLLLREFWHVSYWIFFMQFVCWAQWNKMIPRGTRAFQTQALWKGFRELVVVDTLWVLYCSDSYFCVMSDWAVQKSRQLLVKVFRFWWRTLKSCLLFERRTWEEKCAKSLLSSIVWLCRWDWLFFRTQVVLWLGQHSRAMYHRSSQQCRIAITRCTRIKLVRRFCVLCWNCTLCEVVVISIASETYS